jgi:branched-chain amino acid transport system permease protein
MQFYVSSLLILLGVNIIAIWGLDLQYGVTGINNFAFVVFQAAGAYTAALLSLQPAAFYNARETYIGGFNLPFPIPLVGATLAGGILAVPMGLIAIRRLRGDYQAMAMLVLSLIATGLAVAAIPVLNGTAGLAFVPKPLGDQLLNSGGPGAGPLDLLGYQWFYLGLTAVMCLLAFWVVRGITSSPLGRVMRAVRDSESAASALGRNVFTARMIAFAVGGCLGGLSGGLLATYIGAWAPGSWFYPETFLLFTAIVVGGTGNLLGNVVGALLVPIIFLEVTRFLPPIGYPGLIDSLAWVAIGVLMLAFLWFRPTGLVPERRRRFNGHMMPWRVLRG